MNHTTPSSTLFPYTTLFRSYAENLLRHGGSSPAVIATGEGQDDRVVSRDELRELVARAQEGRSEEHKSELQSPCNLVCRLLLEKKNLQNENCKGEVMGSKGV